MTFSSRCDGKPLQATHALREARVYPERLWEWAGLPQGAFQERQETQRITLASLCMLGRGADAARGGRRCEVGRHPLLLPPPSATPGTAGSGHHPVRVGVSRVVGRLSWDLWHPSPPDSPPAWCRAARGSSQQGLGAGDSLLPSTLWDTTHSIR